MPPQVALCTGKTCRRSPGFAELECALSQSCAVVRARCMGECKGPVVVAHPRAAEPVVLRRVRKPKQRRDLLAFLFGLEGLSERLEQRRLVARSREKAIEKARRGV
ncbi:MAG: hypothetical protein ACJAQ3_001549 [Planctomycetota bacterium]|jgi:hypothetical protein